VIRLSVNGGAGADQCSQLAVNVHEAARSGCVVGVGNSLPHRTGEPVAGGGGQALGLAHDGAGPHGAVDGERPRHHGDVPLLQGVLIWLWGTGNPNRRRPHLRLWHRCRR
jgi:hypothetical protein